jgi:hypothetical protein
VFLHSSSLSFRKCFRPGARRFRTLGRRSHVPLLLREIKKGAAASTLNAARPLRRFPAPPPSPDLPPPVTSARTEPRSVIPTAPPFHSLRFRLLPWCVRGDRAPATGVVHRGQGAPLPPHRHDGDSRAPRRRGPPLCWLASLPPRARLALATLSSRVGGSLRLEGGRAPAATPRGRERASRVPALPHRSLHRSSSLCASAGGYPFTSALAPSFSSWRRGELLRLATASAPLLRRGGHSSQGPSSRQPRAELGDVAIIVRRCCNRCLQMLHECTRSCYNRILEMFQSLSTYVCICVRAAVHDIGIHVCNRFLMSQLLFTDVVLGAYRCCIGFISMFA